MPPSSSSPTHQTLNITALKNLIDQEISNGTPENTTQPASAPMNPSDTATSAVLGLDLQTLAAHSDDDDGTRRAMIELAKTTPVLLTYEAGPDRQHALQAIWQLRPRISDTLARSFARPFARQSSHAPPRFWKTKVQEMPLGPRPYVTVDYIPCDVVPLVDYWPDFVRAAFALRCWRFAVAAGGARLVLEIMDGRLDLLEWLIEMEEKRAVAGLDPEGGAVWPVAVEGSVEAARLMDGLTV